MARGKHSEARKRAAAQQEGAAADSRPEDQAETTSATTDSDVATPKQADNAPLTGRAARRAAARKTTQTVNLPGDQAPEINPASPPRRPRKSASKNPRSGSVSGAPSTGGIAKI